MYGKHIIYLTPQTPMEEKFTCGFKNHLKQVALYYTTCDYGDSWIQLYLIVDLVLLSGVFMAKKPLQLITLIIISTGIVLTCDKYQLWWQRYKGVTHAVINGAHYTETCFLQIPLLIAILLALFKYLHEIHKSFKEMKRRVMVAESLREIRNE